EKVYSEQLLDRQKTLFEELQHRVANNLGFVSGLLAIQASRLSENSEEAAALHDARVRLETMSRVHRRLYDPMNTNMCLKTYFEELCADIAMAAGRENVEFRVEIAPVNLEIEKLMNLSLIVVEVVTNSLKHAFPDGRGGVIEIFLTKAANANACLLVIRDNGVGFPEGFDPAASKRLGFRILGGFMRALQGEMTHANDGGSVVRVSFPS
ncbi:MAG: ATPase, partial [Micavibrio aeruginosavorus]